MECDIYFTAYLLLNRSHCMSCTGGAVNSSLSQQETLCLCPTNTNLIAVFKGDMGESSCPNAVGNR